MKYKIVSATLMIILMIASIFAGASSVNIKSINKDSTETNGVLGCSFINEDQAEKPEWHIGHFWEYNMFINLRLPLIIEKIQISRMEAKIITDNVNEDEYILDIFGNIDYIEHDSWKISLTTAYLDGIAHINRTTLAMKDFIFIFSGYYVDDKVVDITLTIEFNPGLNFFDFPITTTEESWKATSNVNISIMGNVVGSGINEEIHDRLVDSELSFIEKKKIGVIAGEFESFGFGGDFGRASELWYSPDAGYLIKVEENIGIWIYGMTYIMELRETNYNQSGAPVELSRPSGPISGKAGIEYTYTVTAIDPDEDQIYYMFDWGNGVYSEWLGPYDSGDTCSMPYNWSEKGRYSIRVKAKDTKNCITAWSDPLPVSMPKSKSVNLLHITFLQRLVNRFPFLEQLLDL